MCPDGVGGVVKCTTDKHVAYSKTSTTLKKKKTIKLGFPFSTWNFFEASHGKGAADGVGGDIKRRLNSFVAYGSDITVMQRQLMSFFRDPKPK